MNTPLFLDSLEIRQFRAFEHLRIERLGQVNLVVGKNNVGKSSLLEALWLYAHQGSPSIIWQILEARDEGRRPGLPTMENRLNEEIFAALSQLFYRRNRDDQTLRSIRIGSLTDTHKIVSVMLDTEYDEKLNDTVPGLRIQNGGQEVFYRVDRGAIRFRESEKNRGVFIPANGINSRALGSLWDSISLTDLEEEVLEALRIIAPEVERISLINSRYGTPARDRIPIVKIAGLEDPLSLRSLGEGMNRLFGLALALVNAKDSLFLADEVESGLHYSVQPKVWKLIFEGARRLSIQVFATTHSWDCITAFQQAAQEYEQDEGILIRLVEKKGKIVADSFDENDLGIATREEIEVR